VVHLRKGDDMFKKALLGSIVLCLVAAGVASAYALKTIYLTPGHCVTIGSTRVCAVTKRPTATPPPTAGKGNDKGIVVEELDVKNDGLGDIGGVVRLKNTLSRTVTITFTLTFFKANGSVAGTAEGSVDSMAPGETVTANLASEDPISAIPSSFHYQFQVDAEF